MLHILKNVKNKKYFAKSAGHFFILLFYMLVLFFNYKSRREIKLNKLKRTFGFFPLLIFDFLQAAPVFSGPD